MEKNLLRKGKILEKKFNFKYYFYRIGEILTYKFRV